MKPFVTIDCFPESARLYGPEYAVVAIDVIRATTVAITAVATGRRCLPRPSLESAMATARLLNNPLLAGELAGDMPAGFEMNNSPAELAMRFDTERPLVLLSSSGTRLLHESRNAAAVYLACFRNYGSLVTHLATRHQRIAVIGAGSRGDFREEDQMCCAWIAELLIAHGYEAANATTAELVQRWSGAPAAACVISKSVDYLRSSGQLADLDFILSHINDLRDVCILVDGEVQLISQCEHLVGDAEVTTPAAEAKVA